jgi:hypothetical protein
MTKSDKRTDDLKTWLRECFNDTAFSLTPLKSDASFRLYWRIARGNTSYVLMDAPPDREPLEPFIKTTTMLTALGVNVPHIFFQNKVLGALVLTDFGDIDYSQALSTDNAKVLYQQAIDALITIQSMHELNTLPVFDEAHTRMELEIFDEWFLQKHLNIKSHDHKKDYDYLIEIIAHQPSVAIHRDYHSRNLMLTAQSTTGIIDHQDMMQGPISYDLVSLLKDCYIEWEPHLISTLIDYYLDKSGNHSPKFKEWFDVTGVQRHLKAIGIFARLNYLYDNPNYLKYIALPLKYIQDVADKNSKLNNLSNLIKKTT